MPDYIGKPRSVAALKRVDVARLNPITLASGANYQLSQRDWNRITAKIEQAKSGCWLWIGARLPAGYGRTVANKGYVYSHRVMYMAIVGDIPAGLYLDHLCRNPPCCNPVHLEPVTPRENVLRSPIHIAALNALKTECDHGHPLSGENLIVGKKGNRACRACQRIVKANKRAQVAAERLASGEPLTADGRRRWQRNRRPDGRLVCGNGHELTEENTYTKPSGQRLCRKCRSEYRARYRAKEAAGRGLTRGEP